MSYEEFENKYTELRQAINDLKKEYIDSNSPFPVGTKVKITDSEGKVFYGFIREYHMAGYFVLPIISKIKKDGTMHPTQNVWYNKWNGGKIEIAED